jgi:hypothetical protein
LHKVTSGVLDIRQRETTTEGVSDFDVPNGTFGLLHRARYASITRGTDTDSHFTVLPAPTSDFHVPLIFDK